MQLAKEDPIFGYNNFNEAMIHLNKEFLDSNILKQLNLVDGKFELIVTDVVNMIASFLRMNYKIEKMIYFNPTCIYTWVMPNMEYNAAYEPVIGSPFSDDMSFWQRLINFSIKIGTTFMYNNFINSQNEEFVKRGYPRLDPFQPKSLFLNQCANGLTYPISLPPNFAQVGPVLPEEANPVNDKEIKFTKRNTSTEKEISKRNTSKDKEKELVDNKKRNCKKMKTSKEKEVSFKLDEISKKEKNNEKKTQKSLSKEKLFFID